VHEYYIDKCGFRDTDRDSHLKRVLSKDDCNELYDWALSGTCTEDSFANYQHQITKELDPAVFDLSRFISTCKSMQRDSISKEVFLARVCTESNSPRGSKRTNSD